MPEKRIQKKKEFYDIMSQKEKDFVSGILIKTIAHAEIDYSKLFREEKIELKDNDETKTFTCTFGKQIKKSRKFQRESTNTEEATAMDLGLLFSQTYDTLAILNNVIIDEETRKEIEIDLFSTTLDNFKTVKTSKVSSEDLVKLFKVMYRSMNQKSEIFNYLMVDLFKSIDVDDCDVLVEYLDTITLAIAPYTMDKTFYSGLTKRGCGQILKEFLLKQNRKFGDLLKE